MSSQLVFKMMLQPCVIINYCHYMYLGNPYLNRQEEDVSICPSPALFLDLKNCKNGVFKTQVPYTHPQLWYKVWAKGGLAVIQYSGGRERGASITLFYFIVATFPKAKLEQVDFKSNTGRLYLCGFHNFKMQHKHVFIST